MTFSYFFRISGPEGFLSSIPGTRNRNSSWLCTDIRQNQALSHKIRLFLRTDLRTPALKTENFSKRSVVLVKHTSGSTKTLFSLFWAAAEGAGGAKLIT